MSSTERPTKAVRREEARQAALRLRAEQERRARRNRLMAIIGAAAVLVGFMVLVVVIIGQGDKDKDEDLAQVQPSFAADHGGGVVMDADGIVTAPADADEEWPVGGFGDTPVVTVYSDPICPWCAVFEQEAMPVLEEMRLAGDVVVDHRWLNALDVYSLGAQYSTRAANALYTVAEDAPESFLGFTEAIMLQQPEEGTEGLTNEEIAEIALAVGVPQTVVDAFAENRFEWWADQVTNAARDVYDGRIATPSIRLNGEPLAETVDWRDEAQLRQAVEGARG